ncbi:hypothetical protein ABTM34_20380, partial [Acinetobacter baumannii]
MVRSLSNAIIRYPTSFGVWASVVQSMTAGLKEVAIVGKDSSIYLTPFLAAFLPNKILQSENNKNDQFSLLRN